MKRTMILLTPELSDRLKAISIVRGESQSHIVRQALDGHLKRLGYQPGSCSIVDDTELKLTPVKGTFQA